MKALSFLFLQKWLEVSSKRRTGPPSCELCQYQYLRHKKFVVSFTRHFSYLMVGPDLAQTVLISDARFSKYSIKSHH